MVLAPIVIISYVVGLPYGPAGVAFAYSAGMTFSLVPLVLWCLHGTGVAPKDLFVATIRPILAGLASVALAWAVLHGIVQLPSPIVRLLVAGGVMMTAYAGILLFVMGQMKFYSDLFRALLGRPKPKTSPPKTSLHHSRNRKLTRSESQYPYFAIQAFADINGGIGIKPRL
jgi:PST family polysaccharide transporter